jgi:aspartyl/asparaginyl beta-hydroxylase (cupin superfamily)
MQYPLAKLLRTGIERKIHQYEPRPVLPEEDFLWGREVEKYHSKIKSEVLKNVLPYLDEITNFNSVLPQQRALKQNDQWKSFFLIALGKPIENHQNLCPNTAEALKNIPGLINAFFSILRPGVHIPAHRGPYSGILRYHLGVIIPKGDVGIRVADVQCRWEEGKSLYFDDSFDHEAWNHTDQIRVVLFVDIERPLPPLLSFTNKLMIEVFKKSKLSRYAQQKVNDNQINE